MKRPVVVAVAVAALVAAAVLGWTRVRQEREFRRLIAVGDAALAGGQTSAAIEAFSGAVVFKPASMLPHLKRGDAYRRRGEYASALRDLRRSQALDPTATRPIELLGDTYGAMGQHDLALEQYRAYLALDDRTPRLLYKAALASYQKGDAAAAIDPLRRALVMDERLPEAHYLLGMCYREGSRSREALRALQRAVELSPDFAAARAELADLYASMGRTRDEMAQRLALAAIEPVDVDRVIGVALAHVRHGRTDAAIRTLAEAVEAFPESATAHTILGRIWLELAEADADPAALGKAIEALQTPATSPTATSEALTLFGRALFLSGSVAAAERALQLATTQLPVDPQAYRYLAEAASRLGHADIAHASRARHDALADR